MLTICAETPEVVQEGAHWVAMGDCNMSHEQVESVVSSLRPAPSFVCTCDRKRDFIISSAILGDGKEGAVLASDREHWSLVAPVYHHDAVPQRQHGQIDDSEESAQEFPDSDAIQAINCQAAQDVERHLMEQQKITEEALARQEEVDRQEDLMLQQQEAAEQQSAHASSQQVCVDPIVECGSCSNLIQPNHNTRIYFVYMFPIIRIQC